MKSKYKFIDEIKRKNITITNKEKVQNKQNKLNWKILQIKRNKKNIYYTSEFKITEEIFKQTDSNVFFVMSSIKWTYISLNLNSKVN